MIVDTNALSAAAEEDPALIAIFAAANQVAVPVIVLGEYRYGILQSRHHASYEKWLEDLLRDCIVLDVTDLTTQHYAEIRVELKRKGKPIPTNDIWIAALCRQHSLPLLSRDRHFDWIEKMKRVDW